MFLVASLVEPTSDANLQVVQQFLVLLLRDDGWLFFRQCNPLKLAGPLVEQVFEAADGKGVTTEVGKNLWHEAEVNDKDN